MPEGDTLHRTAVALGRALVGQRVTGLQARFRRGATCGAAAFAPLRLDPQSVIGRTVASVHAEGKNLLIEFDDGRTLYTHLRMTGSWHLYRPGDRWRMPAHWAVAVLETPAVVAVCFRAPVVELLSASQTRAHPTLTELGPDIVADSFDMDRAVERLAAFDADRPIADALLDQHAVAGIGNIYKSETLFVCRVDPRLPVRGFEPSELARILAAARTLMRANLDTVARRTRGGWMGAVAPGERFYVYRRAERPCRQCATPVVMLRGEGGRSTYFCPRCQGGAAGSRV